MERLWTPWRAGYVSKADDESDRCIFCEPEEDLLLRSDGRVVILLNLFPYNTGHVMVAPARHIASPGELDPDERRAVFDAMCETIDIVGQVMQPHGFNTGMNLGRVAGAGIPGHMHVHVVPRWGGDTNFMPVVGGTKVMPESLEQTAAKLRPAFG